MSTRSNIGMVVGGEIRAIYCHFDGDLEGVGLTLSEHYQDKSKVEKLLNLGNLSILDKEIGNQQDFNNRQTGWTLSYGRDRGEEGTEADIFQSVKEWLAVCLESWVEYAYLYEEGSGCSGWSYFQDLEESSKIQFHLTNKSA